jgi:hypothetical protein
MPMRWARRVFSHPVFTGISRRHLHLLQAELGATWLAQREGRLYVRRGGSRRRAAGAGRRPVLRFADRLLLTLAHLRLGLPHEALAVAFAVDRSTVTRAIGQVRPLLAGRGCATPTGVRLRTLADLFAYAAAEGLTLRLDATEIRVRRPRAGRGGRKAFVSGKLKQNTIKTTLAADAYGATLWCGSTVRAACTTPPPPVSRASTRCYGRTRRSKCSSTPATRAWPKTIPSRSPPRR